MQTIVGTVTAVIVWLIVTDDLFLGEGRRIGDDYAYFLPHLLGGYYWFLGNGLAPPWFTPAFCGGIPYYPNPQSIYYSVPQFLTYLFDPLASTQITYFLFAVVGFGGAYALAKQLFHKPLTNLFVGFAFLLNGMYMSRIAVGHLTFHTVMLLPLIVYFLLREDTGIRRALNVVFAGGLFAYCVHAGAGVLMIPYLVTVAVILLMFGHGRSPWMQLFYAGLVGIGLSISKLVAVMHFMSEFDRQLYKLPAADGLLTSVYLALRNLTWPLSQETLNNLIVNRNFLFEVHEMDYSIGIVPVAIIIVGALFRLRRFHFDWSPRLILLTVLLALPVLLNTWWAPFNAFLNSLPYFSTSTSLFRWHLIYMLPAILLAARYLHLLPRHQLPWITAIAIAGVITSAFLKDTSGYRAPSYDPYPLVKAYYSARQSDQPPPITRIEEFLVSGMKIHVPAASNSLARGASQLTCNEPLFGYRLEQFQFDNVYAGNVFAIRGGAFNLYRPECFVYPETNQCTAGEPFTLEQEEALSQFTRYRPHDVKLPLLQQIANWLNLSGIVLAGLFTLGVMIRELSSRRV